MHVYVFSVNLSVRFCVLSGAVNYLRGE